MLKVGTLLDGKYKILSEIGRGGMSVVYLALNERANKTWAVKEVRKDGRNNNTVVSQGLIAETEMLKKLKHPNLPSIIDVIDTDDSFIIVMDYIEGRSLKTMLDHSGPQSAEHVIAWSKQLCDVLGYLHSRKPPIIYRDLKPSNVMLRPNEQVALIDFGTAREYKLASDQDTTWLGTRGYAAPEQFGGRGQTDARSDIYNLGATMYHLLTGCSPAQTQFVIYPVGRLRPELSGSGIEKIVSKCCEPEAEDRYQSCAELMYALDHVHDLDFAVLRQRGRRWYAFLFACLAGIAGAAGMVVFHQLETSTSRSSYESLLQSAVTDIHNLDEMKRRYQGAMDLVPSDPKAYTDLLQNLVRNDVSDDENEFTQEERRLFRACINHTGQNRETTNINILREENPDAYANVMYTLGLDYFTYCSNAQQETYNTMTALEGCGALDETQDKIRQTIVTLSDYGVRLNRKQTSYADYQYSYSGLWKKLYEVTHDPAAIDTRSGGEAFSISLYRMAAAQLTMNIRNYVDEGVLREQMTTVLDAADTYLKPKLASSNAFIRKLAESASDNVARARDAITSNFDSVVAQNEPAAAGAQLREGAEPDGAERAPRNAKGADSTVVPVSGGV